MKKRKMFFRMITASLMRRRSRMLVALLAIAIGATILSGLVTIYYDVPRQMGAQFRNYGANMIFTPVEGKLTLTDIEDGISVIKADELVGATPFRYETVRIHEQPVLAAGTDFENAKKTSPYWLVEGEWPAASGEIMVGKNIAENLKLAAGDTLTAVYTKENAKKDAADEKKDEEEDAEITECDFTVVSLLSTGGSEENYVYISMEDLEALTGEGGIADLAEISISASSADLESYTEKIGEAVPSVTASLVKRVTASETTVLSKLQALVLLVTVVVLALTMICVATTMTAVVAERRREIGLRKAIGATDASLIAEFMGEGMLLGGIGGIIGSVVGFAFAQTVSVHVFSSSITFKPLLVPVTIIVSVAVTGLACLLPIRSATRVDPALVLKGE